MGGKGGMSYPSIHAFADELEKQGFIGPLIAGLASKAPKAVSSLKGTVASQVPILSRLKTPIQSMKSGWESMAPRTALRSGGHAAKQLTEAVGKNKPTALTGPAKHLLESPEEQSISALMRGAPDGKNRVQAIAEEMSRRGWTGQGRATKYMPIGEKGSTALGVGLAVPGAVQAARQGDTGATGAEVGGAIGGTAAGLLSAGSGFAAGLPLAIAGTVGGSMLGRRVGQAFARPTQPAQLESQTPPNEGTV